MNGDLRLAVVTPLAAGANVGGVEVFNRELQRALGNVEVIADDPVRRQPSFGDFRRVGLEQPRRAWRAARILRRRHRENPYDLVICNGVSGWPLTPGKLGVPMVEVYHLTVAGLARHALSLRGDRVTTGRVTAVFDRLAGVGKHVVAVSDRVLREVESFYRLRGRTIPNGVDTTAFAPGDRGLARAILGLPPDVPIGLFVGRPDHSKGYDILLEVAARMPDVLFLVIGGEGRAEGNLRPLGRVAHEEMPRWYAASDFLFCPSRYEGFNLALIEALSCNIPAVVSDSGYVLTEDATRCGFLVRGGRPRDYVPAIRAVLEDGDDLSPRDLVVSRYSFETFRESWRSFVESLVGSGG